MHGTVRAEQNKQADARAYQQSSEHGSRGKGALQIQLGKNDRRGAIRNKILVQNPTEGLNSEMNRASASSLTPMITFQKRETRICWRDLQRMH